jgi:hypothetical protein
MAAVGRYLSAVADEADHRGYRYARERIREPLATAPPIAVTTGQLAFEWTHLLAKLERRAPDLRRRWEHVGLPDPHPSFQVVVGPVAAWERGVPTSSRADVP